MRATSSRCSDRADGSRLAGGRLVPTVIVSAGLEAALAEPEPVEAG
ncbi:MAG: hypothetical protein VB141_07685 [Burkholderia gladioli]